MSEVFDPVAVQSNEGIIADCSSDVSERFRCSGLDVRMRQSDWRYQAKSQCGRTVFCQKTGRTPFVLNCSTYLLLKPTGIAYRFSNVFAITLGSYFTVGQSVPCSHNDLTSNCHDFLEKDEL